MTCVHTKLNTATSHTFQKPFSDRVIKVPPGQFVHIVDTNTTVTRVLVGPARLVCLAHERVVVGPSPLIVIPPSHYLAVSDPAIQLNGKPVLDANGQVKLRYGYTEIRFSNVISSKRREKKNRGKFAHIRSQEDPFPPMPGEKIGAIQPLEFVQKHSALRLRAIRDAAPHRAGSEWLFEGPGVYQPSPDVEIVERVTGVVLGPNDALHLRARRDCVDRAGVARKTGEKWLVTSLGAYIVGVDEEIVLRVSAQILIPQIAMHLRATQTFTDAYGVERRVGDEWLVTREQSATHLLNVYETLVQLVALTVLSPTQYAVVSNPYDDQNKPQAGRQINVIGPATLFARPGEKVEGPLDMRVLGGSQALWVTALESFEDEGVKRKAGDRWMVFGPRAYVPPTQVTIVSNVKAVIAIPALNLYVFPTARFYTVLLALLTYIIWWLFFSSGGNSAAAVAPSSSPPVIPPVTEPAAPVSTDL